jgi:hypothetical protein
MNVWTGQDSQMKIFGKEESFEGFIIIEAAHTPYVQL